MLAIDRDREDENTTTMTKVDDHVAADATKLTAVDHLGCLRAKIDVAEVEVDSGQLVDPCASLAGVSLTLTQQTTYPRREDSKEPHHQHCCTAQCCATG